MTNDQRNFKPEWEDLLRAALTVEGSMGNTYTRFHALSLGNIALLLSQGVREPVNTYNGWSELGRQVLRGSKAYAIYRPLFVKHENEEGEKVERLVGFKLLNCMFKLSQTEGPDLTPPPIPGWDKAAAFSNLGITQVPFGSLDRNLQGYSSGREIAINPLARHPNRTLFHEAAHVVLGHTMGAQLAEYPMHRGEMEAEAEGTALITMRETGQADEETDSHSRAYMQNWLGKTALHESSIRHIFGAADKILKAGRIETVGALAYNPTDDAPAEP